MRLTMRCGTVLAAGFLATPLSLAGTVACPMKDVPSFNDCIQVDSCLFYPFFQAPYSCAYAFCNSLVWFNGPPGERVISVTTGPVTCKVRQGLVGPTGSCIGPNPNGTVLSSYTTTGIIEIETGEPC